MTQNRAHNAVLLVVAGFSRHPSAMEWARDQLIKRFGTIVLESPSFDFVQTRYYEATMGSGLRKNFLVFDDLVAPDRLADIKNATIALERELAASGRFPEARPINLDPGFLSLGKFQLATTKDQAHRIYLRDGIYAEVTLRFQDGSLELWPWTYADYQLPEVRSFLEGAREHYRIRLRSLPQ
jgi:hypothetical protein